MVYNISLRDCKSIPLNAINNKKKPNPEKNKSLKYLKIVLGVIE